MEGTQAAAQIVSPTKLAHLVLLTRDLPRMRDWYATVLQAKVTVEDPMLCFISYDDEHHRIAFIGMPELPPRAAGPQVGLHHIAFTYRSLDDLLRTYERLKMRGIEPYWPIHHGVTISMYFRDPDGNNVELQVDAFGSIEEAKSYMRSDSFRNNPIGVIYDPEELIRRHRAGEPFESLRQRPPMPEARRPRTCSASSGERRDNHWAADGVLRAVAYCARTGRRGGSERHRRTNYVIIGWR